MGIREHKTFLTSKKNSTTVMNMRTDIPLCIQLIKEDVIPINGRESVSLKRRAMTKLQLIAALSVEPGIVRTFGYFQIGQTEIQIFKIQVLNIASWLNFKEQNTYHYLCTRMAIIQNINNNNYW